MRPTSRRGITLKEFLKKCDEHSKRAEINNQKPSGVLKPIKLVAGAPTRGLAVPPT